jgi:hypothetical protein
MESLLNGWQIDSVADTDSATASTGLRGDTKYSPSHLFDSGPTFRLLAAMPRRPTGENMLRVAVVMTMLAAPALAQTAQTFPCPCMNSGQCLRIAGTTRTMCYCNQVRIRVRRVVVAAGRHVDDGRCSLRNAGAS